MPRQPRGRPTVVVGPHLPTTCRSTTRCLGEARRGQRGEVEDVEPVTRELTLDLRRATTVCNIVEEGTAARSRARQGCTTFTVVAVEGPRPVVGARPLGRSDTRTGSPAGGGDHTALLRGPAPASELCRTSAVLDIVSQFGNYFRYGRAGVHVGRALSGSEGGVGVVGASLRVRGHDGHRRAAGGAGDVPLRDELRRTRADHGRCRVGGVGPQPRQRRWGEHPVGARAAAGRSRRALRAGAGRRCGDRRPTRRTSSTAIGPTGPWIWRGTAGRSRPTSATSTRAEAEAAIGQPIMATDWQ